MYVRLKPGVGILLPARSFSKTPSYDCIEKKKKKTSSPILIWTKIGNTWKSHCANRNIIPLYFGVNARIPSEFFDQSQNCQVLIGTSIRVPTYCSEQFKLRIKMIKMYFFFQGSFCCGFKGSGFVFWLVGIFQVGQIVFERSVSI